jgi:hypothetical protein
VPDSIKTVSILMEMVNDAEVRFGISLVVDGDIVKEAETQVLSSLRGIGLASPNLAKIASAFAFWIRKLKPISHSPDSKNKYLAINEYVALMVGLSICTRRSKSPSIRISQRILVDWVNSFRVNSHSPSSSMLIFEVWMDTVNP